MRIKSLLSRLGISRSETKVSDDARASKSVAMLDAYVREAVQLPRRRDAMELQIAKDILALSNSEKCIVVRRLYEILATTCEEMDRQRVHSSQHTLWQRRYDLEILLSSLLKKRLPFSIEQLDSIANFFVSSPALFRHTSVLPIVSAVERLRPDKVGMHKLRPHLESILSRLRKPSNQGLVYAEQRRMAERVARLLDDGQPESKIEIVVCDSWTAALRTYTDSLQTVQQSGIAALLKHCGKATGSRPTKSFLKASNELIQNIGEGSFIKLVNCCFVSIGQSAPSHAAYPNHYQDRTILNDAYTDILRGLIWSCRVVECDELIQMLGATADAAFKKLPMFGPRSPKIGNACLWVLSEFESTDAVAQLARLKTRVKNASSQKQVERSLTAAAMTRGIALEELEELATPTCGLTEVGFRKESLGNFIASVSVTATTRAEIQWQKAGGKIQKTVPKVVRENHASELKELKSTVQSIQKMLPAQRDRLESLFMVDRVWDYETWQDRYLNHPLVGFLARRLIWTIRSAEGQLLHEATWLESQLVDCHGETVNIDKNAAYVSLWHPATAQMQQVVIWREFFERQGIKQPFKQAHREIYLLTPAEYETETYSNRFAAHVLEQSRLRALCAARGWTMGAIGPWDYGDVKPTKLLRSRNLRIEYWVDSADEEISESGIYSRVATDQIRFYRPEDSTPLSLIDVPPLVFSEIMRDVDLFVGVASVGNNPEWQDGGPDGRYRDYWNTFSFGDLSGTAQTRKEILTRLVPRLKIADRCSFDDKFLIVRGDRRTYKIHLGSSNILMEPNDQYLCIVPSRGQATAAGGKVFLPFEGDERLAVILSKAFLLAEDAKITDATILSQIGR